MKQATCRVLLGVISHRKAFYASFSSIIVSILLPENTSKRQDYSAMNLPIEESLQYETYRSLASKAAPLTRYAREEFLQVLDLGAGMSQPHVY